MATTKASSTSTSPSTARGISKSIAGRSHGAKDAVNATNSTSPKRWYPQFAKDVHPEIVRAIHFILDNQYEARDDAKKNNPETSKQPAKTGADAKNVAVPESKYIPTSDKASGIHGIPVTAVPPNDGQVLKYNASTGQIEWS